MITSACFSLYLTMLCHQTVHMEQDGTVNAYDELGRI